jgi:hypothetical protein
MTALPRSTLAANTAAESLDALGFAGLEALCRDSARSHAPEPYVATDPRFDLPIVYSRTRSHRLAVEHCVVCANETCPAADIAELPRDGAADGGDVVWLTPNLYPIVYPFGTEHGRPTDAAPGVHHAIRGIHLVQWSSLQHERGLIGAERDTATAIMGQLARAEEFLLHHAGTDYPDSGDGHRGHMGIIKNKGRRVGGSVEHDHQQILITSTAPDEPRRAAGLGRQLLADTTQALVVDDVDGRATTLVAPFMRRPLHAFIVLTALADSASGSEPGHLHHLDAEDLSALALAIARLTAATTTLMEATDEPAWNLVVHTGHGIGPLVELRPFTQPLGGYEQMGLYMCEETPEDSAARLRDALQG